MKPVEGDEEWCDMGSFGFFEDKACCCTSDDVSSHLLPTI